jgi:hypothetical protein
VAGCMAVPVTGPAGNRPGRMFICIARPASVCTHRQRRRTSRARHQGSRSQWVYCLVELTRLELVTPCIPSVRHTLSPG